MNNDQAIALCDTIKEACGNISSELCDISCSVSDGHSLRDSFAMAALSGGLEQGIENDMNTNWWHSPEKIAKRAYAIADAMMELSE